MQNGRVKWFSDKKGFGFIESQGKEYFIHYKEILSKGYKSLKDGDEVSFTPSSGAKGLIATQLSVCHVN